MAKKPIKLSDLVYLRFASNTCYTTVESKKPDDVTLNLAKGEYALEFWRAGIKQSQTFKIGTGRGHFDGKYGTIGVFNRNSTEHLDSMVHLSRGATHERVGSILDD